MAVLSRAGCNSGACHGNQSGKGGFKLSLRGQDAEFDFASLTRDMLGRRVDLQRPDNSLLLAKPTMTQAHEGGQRSVSARPSISSHLDRLDFLPTPTRRRALAGRHARRQVYRAGRPRPTSGARRSLMGVCDVSRLAVYKTSNLGVSVGPRRGGAEVRRATILVPPRSPDRHATRVRAGAVGLRLERYAENNCVDRHVFAKLRSLRVLPSGFHRRCLPATGVPRRHRLTPTVDEARVPRRPTTGQTRLS
jgi:hypothetical protein